MIEQIGLSCFRVWVGHKLIGAYGDLKTAASAEVEDKTRRAAQAACDATDVAYSVNEQYKE